MTLAATITSEEIFKSFLGDSLDKALMHGPTFMGNPLACAAANASLDIFESENYEEKTAAQEKLFTKKLEKCRKLKNVKDIRSLGAVGVIETDLQFSDMLNLRKKFVEKGLFLRPFAGVIYIMPALNIAEKQLTTIIDAVCETLGA